LIDLRSGL
jgi:hypothetical protein